MTVRILRGDVLSFARHYHGERFHALLCDPPYHLHNGMIKPRQDLVDYDDGKGNPYARVQARSGFMGKAWDGGDIAFRPETWAALSELLYPGAFVMAFGGTRTYHRMACAIEDAGFEIRDSIHWVYASGFPKSCDVSKQLDKAAGAERKVIGRYDLPDVADGLRRKSWGLTQEAMNPTGGSNVPISPASTQGRKLDITAPATDAACDWQGYGTALKPAHEPVVLARKPLSETTVAANCLRWGTGALNIDASRISGANGDGHWTHAREIGNDIVYHHGGHSGEDFGNENPSPFGRWPANLITDGSTEVVAMFPQSKSAGEYKQTTLDKPLAVHSVFGVGSRPTAYAGEDGSAARFFAVCPLDEGDYLPLFYAAKASRAEREAGLDEFELIDPEGFDASNGGYNVRTYIDRKDGKGCVPINAKRGPHSNNHPTVKPIKLTEYLARLLLPPAAYAPRRILVPFAGSGSEMIGAYLAGWDEIVGIEREVEYVKIAKARLQHWCARLL